MVQRIRQHTVLSIRSDTRVSNPDPCALLCMFTLVKSDLRVTPKNLSSIKIYLCLHFSEGVNVFFKLKIKCQK